MSLSAVFKVPMVNEVKEGRGKVERNPLSCVEKCKSCPDLHVGSLSFSLIY